MDFCSKLNSCGHSERQFHGLLQGASISILLGHKLLRIILGHRSASFVRLVSVRVREIRKGGVVRYRLFALDMLQRPI